MEFTVIGDLVGSRGAADRRALHDALTGALVRVNDALAPVRPLRITVGDEHQGGFARLEDAVRATLMIRLALRPAYDVRHGIGHGEVVTVDADSGIEDGPGWWSARAGVEAVEELAARPATAQARVLMDPALEGAWTVNLALGCRDAVVSSLSERSTLILRGLLAGRTQRELADELGISTSAVSQRVRRDGLGMLLHAHTPVHEPEGGER